MDQWYCVLDGRQAGPFPEDVLRDMIRQGRIGPADLFWRSGMEDWAPGGTVLPDAFGQNESVGIVAYAQTMGWDLPRARHGTGGQTPLFEIRARARESLRGRWGLPIGFCVLLFLLTQAMGLLPFGLGGLATLILSGPLQLGAIIFFLSFTRGGEVKLGMMFSGFKNFGNALGAYLLVALFTLLWLLLLIIPGIIAAHAYSQTLYILAGDRSVGPLEAIRRSKQMMAGKKWKLFCLNLWFMCLSILCLFTLGIGLLWLFPYMNASFAAFHDDLLQPALVSTPETEIRQ